MTDKSQLPNVDEALADWHETLAKVDKQLPEEPFDKETRAEIESQRGQGMTSAVGEYTPEEFWTLLDAYDALRDAYEAQKAEIEELKSKNQALEHHINHEMKQPDVFTTLARLQDESAGALASFIEMEAQKNEVVKAKESAERRVAELEAELKKILVKEWHRGSLMLQIEDKCEIEAVLKGTK